MNIQTLTGTSIGDALAEARRRLGDGIVLVESTAAAGGQPARIRVAVDEAPARREAGSESGSSSGSQSGFGYGPPSRFHPVAAHTAAQAAAREGGGAERAAVPAGETLSARAGAAPAAFASTLAEIRQMQTTVDAAAARRQEEARSEAPYRRRGGRGRLFPAGGSGEAPPAAATTEREALLEAQLERLNNRLDGMERRFGGAVIGSAQRWTAHPLFSALLERGLQPSTATKLFDDLADRGHDASDDAEALRWALAQALRRRLDVAAPKHHAGALLALGPSGAGKTSLLLKLAGHANFFARHQPAVIAIAPEEDESLPYHPPTELYRRFGLPVQCVGTEEEMARALERVEGFGQILIDTPPLPLQKEAARRMLRRVQRLVRPVVPLQVHLAINATRALDGLGPGFFGELPLRPDAVALTHLDETSGWGRIAEWLLRMRRPVQFVSTGPAVPAGVRAFSPSWFVEEIMDLG